MRFKELIKEAPISDIQPMGDPDPEIDYDHTGTDGFGPGDEGIPSAWTEPEKRNWLSDEPKAKKWRDRVVKSWSKTKNNYLIIPVFGEDAYNYEIIERGSTTALEMKMEFPNGYEFLHEIGVLKNGRRTAKHKDKTVVFFLGNGASEWVRASGWMLLHRLGHAARTDHNEMNPAYRQALTLMFEQLQDTFANFGVDFFIKRSDPYGAREPWHERGMAWADYALQKVMTMRSARKMQLRDRYEALYEMWAQYLNTGKVTLRVPDKFDFNSSNPEPKIEYENELYPGDKQMLANDIQQFEDIMNEEAFPPLEESIAGQILLM